MSVLINEDLNVYSSIHAGPLGVPWLAVPLYRDASIALDVGASPLPLLLLTHAHCSDTLGVFHFSSSELPTLGRQSAHPPTDSWYLQH